MKAIAHVAVAAGLLALRSDPASANTTDVVNGSQTLTTADLANATNGTGGAAASGHGSNPELEPKVADENKDVLPDEVWIPINTTSESEFDNSTSHEKEGTWDGMFYDYSPSKSQSRRGAKVGTGVLGKLPDIPATLVKNLVDVGDEDVTPYYVNRIPDAAIRHHVKKKDVVIFFRWVMEELDKMRKKLVADTAASDPMLLKLTEYMSKLGRFESRSNNRIGSGIEASLDALQELRKLVNERAESVEQEYSQNSSAATSSDAMFASMSQEIKTLMGEAAKNFTHHRVSLKNLKSQNTMLLNKFYGLYQHFQEKKVEQLSGWGRDFSRGASGRLPRYLSQASGFGRRINTFIAQLKKDELERGLHWYDQFLHAFDRLERRSQVLETTAAYLNTGALATEKRTTKKEEFARRAFSLWQEGQAAMVNSFKNTVLSLHERYEKAQQDEMRLQGKREIDATKKRISSARDFAKLQIMDAEKDVEKNLNGEELRANVSETRMALVRNLSRADHQLGVLPSMEEAQGNSDMKDKIAEFGKELESTVLKPELNQESRIIHQLHRYWSDSISVAGLDGRSTVKRAQREISARVEQAAKLLAAHLARTRIETVEQIEATQVMPPLPQRSSYNAGELYSRLSADEAALVELQGHARHLHIDLPTPSLHAETSVAPLRDEWRQVVHKSLALLEGKLSARLPGPPRADPAKPPSASRPLAWMWTNLSHAGDVLAKLPEVVRESQPTGVALRGEHAVRSFGVHLARANVLSKLVAAASMWLPRARVQLTPLRPAALPALEKLSSGLAPLPSPDLERGVQQAERALSKAASHAVAERASVEARAAALASQLKPIPLPSLPASVEPAQVVTASAAQLGLHGRVLESLRAAIRSARDDAQLAQQAHADALRRAERLEPTSRATVPAWPETAELPPLIAPSVPQPALAHLTVPVGSVAKPTPSRLAPKLAREAERVDRLERSMADSVAGFAANVAEERQLGLHRVVQAPDLPRAHVRGALEAVAGLYRGATEALVSSGEEAEAALRPKLGETAARMLGRIQAVAQAQAALDGRAAEQADDRQRAELSAELDRATGGADVSQPALLELRARGAARVEEHAAREQQLQRIEAEV